MCKDCELELIQKTVDQLALDKLVFGKSFVKHEAKFMKLLNKYFDKQYQEGLKLIDNALFIQKDLAEDILDEPEDRLKKIEAQLEQEYINFYTIGALVQDGAVQKELLVGIKFGIQDDLANQYAKEKVGTLITNIDEISRTEINGVINYAMENRLSSKEAAELLQTNFKQFSSRRSLLIARMEATTTYAFGSRTQFAQYQEHYGVKGYKRTQSVVDGKTRKSHRNADDMGWIPIDDAYPDLDNDMGISVYYAPFDFNCRCVTIRRITNPESGLISRT